MPGYDTHYIFGMISYRQSESENIRALIRTCKNEFALGLFGPDLFFYSIPEALSSYKNTGSVLHTEKTNLFFRNMYKFAMTRPNIEKHRILPAYFLGFLGHYCLDCACHAFIYSRSGFTPDISNKKKYLGEHFSLETDIDIALLQRLFHETPPGFARKHRLDLSSSSISDVAEMLKFALDRTYGYKTFSTASIKTALLSTITGSRLIKSCPPKLKQHIKNAENILAGRSFISSLIPGSYTINSKDPLNLSHEMWTNPWDESLKSDEDFISLMNKAKAEYIKLLDLTDEAMRSGNETGLFEAIGNRSYHSGLPL